MLLTRILPLACVPPLALPAAEEINKRADEYWQLVLDIARKNNLKRILRCTQVGVLALGSSCLMRQLGEGRILRCKGPGLQAHVCAIGWACRPGCASRTAALKWTRSNARAARMTEHAARPPCVPIRQIMGRSENDELSASQVFYPCMQAADIFFLKVWRSGVGMAGKQLQPACCNRLAAVHLLGGCRRGIRYLRMPMWRHAQCAAAATGRRHTHAWLLCGMPMQADICQLGMDQRKVGRPRAGPGASTRSFAHDGPCCPWDVCSGLRLRLPLCLQAAAAPHATRLGRSMAPYPNLAATGPLAAPNPARTDAMLQCARCRAQVNMLAREFCDDCKPKRLKPVILSHPMMPGLLEVG